MQKVITVTIDLERLQEAGQQEDAQAVSFAAEVPELNQWLEEGWVIEEWENLSANAANGRVTLLFILTDELLYDMPEAADDSELQLEEEQEEE
ncbi:MAG TPA: hypothetical protein VGE90_15655 [Chitinophaga sp.]